jgi:hypothetical protein
MANKICGGRSGSKQLIRKPSFRTPWITPHYTNAEQLALQEDNGRHGSYLMRSIYYFSVSTALYSVILALAAIFGEIRFNFWRPAVYPGVPPEHSHTPPHLAWRGKHAQSLDASRELKTTSPERVTAASAYATEAAIDVRSLAAASQLCTASLAMVTATSANATGVATDAQSLAAELQLRAASQKMAIAASARDMEVATDAQSLAVELHLRAASQKMAIAASARDTAVATDAQIVDVASQLCTASPPLVTAASA